MLGVRQRTRGFEVGGRAGFTLVEMILVMVIMGLISAIGFPVMTQARASAALRSGRVQFMSSLATARAAAVRWSRPAQLKRTGNSIQVRADTSGTGVFVALAAPIALDAQFNVTLSGTADSIVFGARGLATNLSSSGARFALVRGGVQDSVCLTRLGEVAPRGCR